MAERIATKAHRLRSAVLRDPATGNVVEKPKVPPMRVVIKGGWRHEEVGR